MKYIDAEKLKAEIERQIQNLRGIAVDNPMLAQTMRLSFEGLLSFIESLQQEQPQVADASKTLDGLMEEVKRYYSENYAYITSDQPTLSILTNIARHFYELGLRARKEE